jgi:hypothetical protein
VWRVQITRGREFEMKRTLESGEFSEEGSDLESDLE